MRHVDTRMGRIRYIVVCLAMLGVALPAMAQDDPTDRGIDEIIVTATKREQSIQEVPIAVSAFAGEDLANRGITELEDLQQVSPSISVYGSNSTSNGGTIRIRGMGTTGNNPGLEAAVGSFIDGVYRSRSGQAYGDFIDVERIEILRGPQGTLFGKNTSAGAVHIITKGPEFEFGGHVSASYGNFDHKKVTASVTGPLIAEELAFRVSGSWHDRDGFYEDIDTTDAYNDRDRYTIRGQLLWTPDEDFSARLIADYTDADETCCPAGFQAVGPTGPLVDALNGTTPPTPGGTTTTTSVTTGLLTPFGSPGPFGPGLTLFSPNVNLLGNEVSAHTEGRREVGVNFKPEETVEDWGVQLEMNWDWNEMTFTSITSYREYESFRSQDIDFTNADILRPQFANDEFENFTQEFRAIGSWGELDWLVGVYAYTEDIKTDEEIRFSTQGGEFFNFAFGFPSGFDLAGGALPFPLTFAGLLPDRVGYSADWEQESEGYAIFSQNTYHVNDRFDVTFGFRYSREKKDASASINGGAPGQTLNDLTPSIPVALGGDPRGWCETLTTFGVSIVRTVLASLCDNQSWDRSATEREWTGTVALSYAINDDLNSYVSFSRGYKAGGFNLDQESVDSVICIANPIDNTGFGPPGGTAFVNPDFGDLTLFTGTTPGGEAECVGLAEGDIGLVRDNAAFSPEFANSYELGIKGSFLDGALTVNTAFFFTKFKDFQLNTFNGFGFTISNVPQVESRGFELESFYAVSEELFLTFGVTYADTRYGDDVNLSNPLDAPTGGNVNIASFVDGQRITHSPAWQGSASLSYQRNIPNTEWTGLFSTNVAYRGRSNTGSNLHPIKMERDNTIVNLQIGASSPEGAWDIVLWGNNVTDNFVNTLVFDSVFQSGSFHTFFNPPRMYGVTVKYHFGEGA